MKTEAAEGLIIPSMADENTGSLSLTLDSSGLGALSSAIDYVFDYPFLCMEQQSARILPLVLFENYIDVFSLKSKVPNVRHTVKNDGGMGAGTNVRRRLPLLAGRLGHELLCRFTDCAYLRRRTAARIQPR